MTIFLITLYFIKSQKKGNIQHNYKKYKNLKWTYEKKLQPVRKVNLKAISQIYELNSFLNNW